MSFIRFITDHKGFFWSGVSALLGIASLYLALVTWPVMTAEIQQVQGLGQSAAGPISEKSPARQTFKAKSDSFGGVGLIIATGGLSPSDGVLVSIRELEGGSSKAARGRVIARSELSPSKLTDWALTVVRFQPVRLKVGAIYAIEVTAGPVGEAYIAASKYDAYKDGELYLGGMKQPGDAAFRVYRAPTPTKLFDRIGSGEFMPLVDAKYVKLALVLFAALLGLNVLMTATSERFPFGTRDR